MCALLCVFSDGQPCGKQNGSVLHAMFCVADYDASTLRARLYYKTKAKYTKDETKMNK